MMMLLAGRLENIEDCRVRSLPVRSWYLLEFSKRISLYMASLTLPGVYEY